MREVALSRENLHIIEMLRRIERFSGFSDRDLRSLVEVARLREYAPGETVIREGEFDCWVYFLLTGALEIVKGEQPVGRLQRLGDLFGEMGIIDGSPRSATIRAVKNSLILGVDGSVVDRQVKKRDLAFCYTIYRLFAEVLAARLRATTEENIRLTNLLQHRSDEAA
ncbi:MAG: cyclic nucleotide-binding domain-containing protein [Thermodesulfobacteriota bacterium]